MRGGTLTLPVDARGRGTAGTYAIFPNLSKAKKGAGAEPILLFSHLGRLTANTWLTPLLR